MLMLGGFPAQVHPSDDDKIHLGALLQWGVGRMKEQNPITPGQAALIGQHTGDHLQQLAQRKDPLAKTIERQMLPMLQILAQVAQSQPQMMAGAPQMGQPMPPGAPAASQNGANGQNQQISDAAKLMNGLSGLLKAGVPVSHDEINAVMRDAGLPPLPFEPIVSPDVRKAVVQAATRPPPQQNVP